MPSPEEATIRSLRRDLALQVSRTVRGLKITQVVAAKRLGVPQPTLSKLINGRIDNLSIELLIRIAIRAGLLLTLLTGDVPEEAGVFVVRSNSHPPRTSGTSFLAEEARHSRKAADLSLTPAQRLEAFLEHNQLLAELHQSGRAEEKSRARKARRSA